jgi:hypothetical protein
MRGNMAVQPIKSGSDLMSALEAEAIEYFRVRRLQVKSLARLKATTEVQILIFPMIEKNASNLDSVYLKDAMSVDWLTNLMVSVQPDSKKLEEAVAHIKGHFDGRVRPEILNDLVEQFLVYVKEDFNAMRGMKQSIYYRSRSLNSIFRFFDKCENSFRSKSVLNKEDVQIYLSSLKNLFLLEAEGEKYTKNSYLGEFFSFISDIEPPFLPEAEAGVIKSLDAKFIQSVSNLESITSSNHLVRSAYEQFSKLLQNGFSQSKKTSKNSHLDSDFSDEISTDDTVQIHLRKGEGVEISFKSAAQSKSRILELEELLLLSLLKKNDTPDVSIDSSRAKIGELSIVCAENTSPGQLLELRKLLLSLAATI